MRKFICFLFFCCLTVLGLVSCRDKNKIVKNKNIKVVATIFPQYDFCRELTKGVDGAEVIMLSSPGVDIHCFEPTPKDIATVKNSDLFVYVGGKNDVWVEKILDSVEKEKCSAISLLEILRKSGKKEEDLKDDHVWTSILNCVKIVEYLKDKFCKIDKVNCEKYKKNGEEYVKKLLELEKGFKDLALNKKKDFVIFADRFPFSNLFKDYGLNVVSPYHGCSSKSEVSPFDMKKTIEKATKERVSVVLKTEGGNKDIANTIASSCNAKILTLNSCHSCSKEDFKKGKTFLEYYNDNLKTLKEAFG